MDERKGHHRGESARALEWCYLHRVYGDLKNLILVELGVWPAQLHLVLGIVVYAICFAATRRPWLSLWAVVALQLGNETLDAREDLRSGNWSLREAVLDTIWTVTLPFVAASFFAAIRAVSAIRRKPR